MRSLIAAFTLLVCSLFAQETQAAYIGVLEPETDQPRSFTNYDDALSLRLVFHSTGNAWEGMPEMVGTSSELEKIIESFPKSVLLHNKITTIKATLPAEWEYYSQLGLYNPHLALSQISWEPNALKFSSWAGTFLHKPLVFSSEQTIEKKMQWPESNLTADEKNKLFNAYRKQLPTFDFCITDDHTESRQWKTDDVEIQQPLRSKEGVLVGVQLKASLNHCDMTPDGFGPFWFYLHGNKVNFLGHDIMPLDYGDYNGDGKEEWVFWFSGYDDDGYILFYNAFNDRSEFHWSYH